MTSLFKASVRPNRAAFAFVGTALCLAGSALAAAPLVDDAVTLVRTAKKGDINKYSVEATASVSGVEASLKNTLKYEVKEVKADGVVVVEVSDEGGKLVFGGMEMDAPQSPAVTETREKSGKLTKAVSAADNPVFPAEVVSLLAAVREVVFTDKPVKSGDTWNVEFDNPAVKGKKITLKSTYSGIDKVDGKDFWKVKHTGEAEVNAAGEKVTFEMTEWREPATGRIEKGESSVKGIPTAMLGNINMTMKTSRVK